MTDLTDRIVLITGASRGIGEAAAREMAARGAKVALLARSGEACQRIAAEIGERAIGMGCDVGDYDAVAAAFEAVAERFGPVDTVINNAGLMEPIARIESSDPAAWAEAIRVNLVGAYNVARAALPGMAYLPARDGVRGTIINISSGAATGALEGWSHYCASKAGLLSFTRCLHKELAETGLRTVGLSPGTVATDMQVAIKQSGLNPVSRLDPSVHIPAEWVARALVWLAAGNGRAFDGGDFSIKTEEGRRAVGLPGLE